MSFAKVKWYHVYDVFNEQNINFESVSIFTAVWVLILQEDIFPCHPLGNVGCLLLVLAEKNHSIIER